jgi:hypothetical protein
MPTLAGKEERFYGALRALVFNVSAKYIPSRSNLMDEINCSQKIKRHDADGEHFFMLRYYY